MRHRFSELYTVMLVKTDQPPVVLRIRPVLFWLIVSSFAIALVIAFWAGWQQGRNSLESRRLSDGIREFEQGVA